MAENVMKCPICGSELFISKRVVYCSNPKCNYASNIAQINAYKRDSFTISLLPFAFLLIAIGLIFITMIFFTANVFFLFIPFILPIPILKKIKRKRSTLRELREREA
ncbi:MAG: hypothetical protein ACUVTD_04275 [Nitrososphaerales archaeon]